MLKNMQIILLLQSDPGVVQLSVHREWICKKGQLPADDSRFFENMTRIIFQAGLNWKMMNAKWPAFYEAFMEFDVNKVANFTEEDVHQLMNNAKIIRNAAKIKATIQNAETFQEIAAEFGSFRQYLEKVIMTLFG